MSQASGPFAGVVQRPVAVTMIFLAALVFGLVSYGRLPIELMPDISYPTLTVRTAFDGAAPEEIEDQISQPIEEGLATLDGLVSLESRSRAGSSDVVLGFDWSTNMSAAAQSIREQLQTTWLPEGAGRPLLLRYDPSLEPFMRLAMSTDPEVLDLSPDKALFKLREIAEEELKRRLEGMSGVAAVRVRGGLEREIRVAVREDWLAARRLTLASISSVLSAENVNLAGGSILEGETEYLVRTLNEYSTLEELRSLKIRRKDGVLVPLTDVAEISETSRERTVLSHLDGAEAVELEIFKEADANVVAVAESVHVALFGAEVAVDADQVEAMEPGPMREALEEQLAAAEGIVDTLPAGMRLVVLDDQADFIEAAISNLAQAVQLGGLFAVGVLFLFLRDFRATAIIGLAIPVSVVLGFAPLYLWGVSLNLMSLGGLALGVGMLVDNAVVVLEAIQRHLDDGKPRPEAAVLGVSEVAVAVIASTLTTVAVFAPIGFVEGIGGQLFGDLSLAVVGSLLASLVVALFGVPTLAALGGPQSQVTEPIALGREALWAPLTAARQARDGSRSGLAGAWLVLRPWVEVRFLIAAAGGFALVALQLVAASIARIGARVGGAVLSRIAAVLLAAAGAFQSGYDRFAASYARLSGPIVRSPWTVLAAAGLAVALAVQLGGQLGAELLPEVHQGRFTVHTALPVGTPLEETTRVVSALEEQIARHPEIATVYTTIGTDQRADSSADEGEHSARIRVQLTPGGDLARREDSVMSDLREVLSGKANLKIRFERPALFSFKAPLEVLIYGRDLETLRATGDAAVAALVASDALADVQTSLAEGNPEVRITYDRLRLARFGLDPRTVATTVRDRVQGVSATEIHRRDQRLDLRVQLAQDQRSSLADLRRLNINPDVVPPVPLEAVADFVEAIGPSEIRRVDQRRAVSISANLASLDMAAATRDVSAAMARVPFTDDQSWSLGGQADELEASLSSLAFATMLAIFLVYVIMASTFEHLLHPLVILFTVPLALVGVVAGLYVFGLPISVVASIGGIVLAGVVVNNAIVLVDAINRLRADGMPRIEAIREAARIRLRPILITTATTVLGLLPLAFGSAAGAEVQRPLAVTVIGGLTVSTLLTLAVIPAVYTLFTARSADVTPVLEGGVREP